MFFKDLNDILRISHPFREKSEGRNLFANQDNFEEEEEYMIKQKRRARTPDSPVAGK